jgi:hypothetical protein
VGWAGAAHQLLTGLLGLAVHRARVNGVELGVGAAEGAVEDVVGGDVHEVGTGGSGGVGDVPRSGSVDSRGGRLIGLGAVDVGPGGAVDDRLGPRGVDGGAHGVGVGDVEVGPGERHHFVVPCGRHDVAAQHARGSRHEEAHGPNG